MGNVYKQEVSKRDRQTGRRRSKKWIIEYTDVHGKRQQVSSGTVVHADAVRLMQKLEGAKVDGVILDIGKHAWTWADAEHAIEADYKKESRSSLGEVQRILRKHLRPVFGGVDGTRKMLAITTKEVDDYYMARLDGHDPTAPLPPEGTPATRKKAARNTINHELATLRRMFKLGLLAKTIPHAPHVSTPRSRVRRTGVFDPFAFDAVHRKLPDWLRDPMRTGYIVGWRFQSEVATLEWRNINRTTCRISLDPLSTKTDKGRVFPYRKFPELVAIIERAWAAHVALAQQGRIVARVFHRDGQPLTTRYKTTTRRREVLRWYVRKAWRDACTAAGLAATVIPHDFRRTACRTFVENGVNEKHAMELVGWESRAMLDHYHIVDVRDLERAVETYAGAFEEQRRELRAATKAPRRPQLVAPRRRRA